MAKQQTTLSMFNFKKGAINSEQDGQSTSGEVEITSTSTPESSQIEKEKTFQTTWVASSSCVKDVKEQLQLQVSIPVDQQKLIFQGKPLSDDKLLAHYKITDGSKLFLMLKKPGRDGTPATSSSTPSLTPGKLPSPMVVDTQEEPFTLPDDPTGFWGKLFSFLKRHFIEKDAIKVFKEFKKDMDHGLSRMSLDDIERLATNKLCGTDGPVIHPVIEVDE